MKQAIHGYNPKRDPRNTLLFHIACIRTVTSRLPEYTYSSDQIRPSTLSGSMACALDGTKSDTAKQEGSLPCHSRDACVQTLWSVHNLLYTARKQLLYSKTRGSAHLIENYIMPPKSFQRGHIVCRKQVSHLNTLHTIHLRCTKTVKRQPLK